MGEGVWVARRLSREGMRVGGGWRTRAVAPAPVDWFKHTSSGLKWPQAPPLHFSRPSCALEVSLKLPDGRPKAFGTVLISTAAPVPPSSPTSPPERPPPLPLLLHGPHAPRAGRSPCGHTISLPITRIPLSEPLPSHSIPSPTSHLPADNTWRDHPCAAPMRTRVWLRAALAVPVASEDHYDPVKSVHPSLAQSSQGRPGRIPTAQALSSMPPCVLPHPPLLAPSAPASSLTPLS